MPLGSFDRLYRTWIDRCCQGELADAVIEARSAAGEVVGMVTVALVDDTGRIGLIAVSERARGQGLGAALVQQAHINLRSRGAVRAEVVTQGTNTTACRLYGACGYAVSAIANVYHFWLR
jgi:ribosomal protein S18 acetylase RimI-like enzyme